MKNYEKKSTYSIFRISGRLLRVFLFLFSVLYLANNKGESINGIHIKGDAIVFTQLQNEITEVYNENVFKIQGYAIVFDNTSETNIQKTSQKKVTKQVQRKEIIPEKSSRKKNIKKVESKSKFWYTNSSSSKECFSILALQNSNFVLPISTNFGKPNISKQYFQIKPLILSKELTFQQYPFLFASKYLFPKIFCRPPTNFL